MFVILFVFYGRYKGHKVHVYITKKITYTNHMTKKEDKRQLFAASFNFTSQCKILEPHNYKHNPLTATSQSPISGRKSCIYIIFSLAKRRIYLLLLSRLRRFAFAVLDCMLKNNPVMLDSITSMQEHKFEYWSFGTCLEPRCEIFLSNQLLGNELSSC